MRLYLDSSALVKLYVVEDGSSLVRQFVDQAEIVSTSLVTYVEARAALSRRRREGVLGNIESALGFEVGAAGPGPCETEFVAL